ncbi:MAG: hypothetical protein KDA66_14800, partial [Planctomycetaceae bacterium]|nr:hypothetical protein [Planctomycetaceae bacterium]
VVPTNVMVTSESLASRFPQIKHPACVNNLTLTSDWKLVSGSPKLILIHDLTTKNEIARLPLPANIQQLTLNSSELGIIFQTREGCFELDLLHGRQIEPLQIWKQSFTKAVLEV